MYINPDFGANNLEGHRGRGGHGYGMDRDSFLKEVCDVFHLTLEEKVTALLAGVVVVVVVGDEAEETVDTDTLGGGDA